MSLIEELPDESISLNKDSPYPISEAAPTAEIPPAASLDSTPFPAKSDAAGNNGTTPSLPPQMASVRSHTADEIVQMMNKAPLFMTSLDDGVDDGENVELEAMRALQYEGTPAENALGFKEQGNEMVRVKRWADAKEFYTKGIAVLTQKKLLQASGSEENRVAGQEDENEQRKGKEIKEACYVNRALCNLELKNYRSTTLDCASALRINPKNIKAYYRSASALLALDKIAESLDSISRGKVIDPGNSALEKLNTRIEERQAALTALQQKKQVKQDRLQKEMFALATALASRKIRSRTTNQPPEMEDAAVHLTTKLDPSSVLVFPVVLLYPLHLQSDFIKAFSETDTVAQHLEYIFPLPWDERKEYTLESIEYYMETAPGGMVRFNKGTKLGKLLGTDGIEVVDGVVRINVVLKDRAKAWIQQMKLIKGK